MKNLLLIGNGKWGQKYISTLSAFPNVKLQVATRSNWKSLVDERPDGVMVCTPPESHVELAAYSLEKDIPTMIEKPLSLSVAEASILQKFSAPILVNHIHLFSTAYQNLQRMIKPHTIDKIVSLGYNNGPIRSYSSLWDYGCHDLSMILDLTRTFPFGIQANQISTDTGSLFNIKLDFVTFSAESLVGNGGQKPVRKLKVECGGLKIAYDDKMRSPNHSPPLTNALNTFIRAIDGEKDYRLGLDLSIKVIKILESCHNLLNLPH
jgi:hypothetical protein